MKSLDTVTVTTFKNTSVDTFWSCRLPNTSKMYIY